MFVSAPQYDTSTQRFTIILPMHYISRSRGCSHFRFKRLGLPRRVKGTLAGWSELHSTLESTSSCWRSVRNHRGAVHIAKPKQHKGIQKWLNRSSFGRSCFNCTNYISQKWHSCRNGNLWSAQSCIYHLGRNYGHTTTQCNFSGAARTYMTLLRWMWQGAFASRIHHRSRPTARKAVRFKS